MASVLLVVGNLTLSASDQALSDKLTSVGHTVTTQLSTTALPDTGFDACVVTESGSSGSAAILSIPACLLPVLLMETTWNTARMTSTAATAGAGAGQALDVIATTHDIVAGIPDPVTIHSSAVNMYGTPSANIPAGVVDIAEHTTTAGHCVLIAADTGAVLTSGNAPNRRVCYGGGVASNAVAAWTADSDTIYRQAVVWLVGTPAPVGPQSLRPGFMSGAAFPGFMAAPSFARWPPAGAPYDTGLAGPQALSSSLTAALGFTGSQAKGTAKGLTAATVSFTGTLARRTARALAATLSFTGTLTTLAVHNFTQAFTAALSFAGAVGRRTAVGKSATVGFTGSQTRGTAKSASATVGFTGAQARRTGRAMTAAVSLTGTQTRRIAHGMTAAVSFTGSLATAAVHFFTQSFTATIGFTGSLATLAVHVFTKTLTATIGFSGTLARRTSRSVSATVGLTTGALTRRIGSSQTATVGFVGGVRRAISHRLSAAVGFVGNLLGQGSSSDDGTPVDNPVLALTTARSTLVLTTTDGTLLLTTARSILTDTTADGDLELTAPRSTLDLTGAS